MATSNDQLPTQKEKSRLGFLRNPNRKVKVIDGNKLFKASSSCAQGTGTTSSSHADSKDHKTDQVESKQQQQIINKPLKAEGVAAKTTASSRIRAYWNSLKNGKKTQSCQIPKDLIKKKETAAQVSNIDNSAADDQLVKKRVMAVASKEKKETLLEPPKPKQLNVAGSSKIALSPKAPCKQKKETSTKESSASLVKKKNRIREQKLSEDTELLLTKQLLGLLRKYNKTETDGAGPSNLLSDDKDSSIDDDDEYHHHIEWEGFDEEIHEPFGMTCQLCEGDITEAAEYDPEIERVNPAVTAAVLSCGHVFHCHCLEFATPEDNSTDPPCMICISLSS